MEEEGNEGPNIGLSKVQRRCRYVGGGIHG
jgi:hypothetical protein